MLAAYRSSPPLRALAALAIAGCAGPADAPAPHLTELHAGPYRGFVLAAKGRADQAPSIQGDLALDGPGLSIEVRATGAADERGAIVALRQPTGNHDWEALNGLLAIEGRTLVPRVEVVRLATVSGRPAAVVEAEVATDVGRFAVRRTLRLADVPGVVHVQTRVRPERGAAPPPSLEVVERVAWGGGSPLAPVHGRLLPGIAVDAEWVARMSDAKAVVIGPLRGQARMVGHGVDHGRADLLRYTDVALPLRAVSGGSYLAEALLAVSNDGLGDAVRRLGWARGRPFVEALATLSTQPPGAQVEVIDARSKQLVVAARVDDARRAILPLPAAATDKPLLVGARAGGVEVTAWRPLEGPPYAPVTLEVSQSSHLVVVVRDAATGQPLPSRVRILPQRGTRPPSLGPDWSAAGAIDTVITANGRADIPLAAGYYRVIATHGPEWSVADRFVELRVAERVELLAELERAIDPGPWIACELHVHSAPSPDSQVALEDRVASLVAEGIAFAVPTDHNHVTDFEPAAQAQPLWRLGTVPGVEVTTEEPLFGHFNAFPYPLDPSQPGQGAPAFRGLAPAELFASLHAVSPELVVQVNHPRIEGGIGYFEAAGYDAQNDRGGPLWSPDFDTLEVWNGFDLARWPSVERMLGDFLSMLEHGHRIVATGSSDSHTIRSEGAGYPRTYVLPTPAGMGRASDVIAALRRGRAFVTSGPFLDVRVGEHAIGDEVLLDEHPLQVEVFVQVPAWIQVTTLRVYLGSELLRTVPLGTPRSVSAIGRRYQRVLRLSVEREGPLVITVGGDTTLDPVVARKGVRPFAFTNPIWLVRPRAAPEEAEPAPAQPPPELGRPADAGPRVVP